MDELPSIIDVLCTVSTLWGVLLFVGAFSFPGFYLDCFSTYATRHRGSLELKGGLLLAANFIALVTISHAVLSYVVAAVPWDLGGYDGDGEWTSFRDAVVVPGMIYGGGWLLVRLDAVAELNFQK